MNADEQDVSMSAVNPYAPSAVDEPAILIPKSYPAGPVSNLHVLSRTLVGVVVSGSIFGVGLVLLESLRTPTAMLPLTIFASFVGAVFALIASVFAIPFVFALSCIGGSKNWSRQGVLFFGAACGFLSGFICIFIMNPSIAIVPTALMPGVVGAIGTLCVVMKTSIRVGEAFTKDSEPI